MLRARNSNSSQEFGHRKMKKKQPKAPKVVVQLTADDIGVPDGIFREAGGELLKQVHFASIGSDTRGVVVVDLSQALPYAKLTSPVSKRGLALIVVDTDHPEVETIGMPLRFPAKCERTGEPVIISARILQIGNVAVVRTVSDQICQVEEVATVVIRMLTYRDELSYDWNKFLQQPVKTLLASFDDLQPKPNGQQVVIDCWDRQYVSLKLEKTRPIDAAMYIVTFRLEGVDLKSVLQQSGTDAIYVEPRDVSGKQPHEGFRVVWLNKHDKSMARLAQQSTPKWTSLVRSGVRYGIRVASDEAEEVHAQHKPQTPFLDATTLKTYHVGPWPYGATKSTIHKVFQTWGWSARPIQARSRAIMGNGLIWEVQACTEPMYTVWQLSHGDVLITEVPKKAKPTNGSHHGIQGSQRTIDALKVSKGNDVKGDPQQDPSP